MIHRLLLAFLSAALVVGCTAPHRPGASTGSSPGISSAPSASVARPTPAPDAKAIDAEAAAIFSGQHGKMPPMQQMQRAPAGSFVIIEMKNDTPYTLTVLYSGATSQRLNIAKSATGSVRVEPGEYLVTARADAGNVIPFAGKQTLQPGSYSTSWYIRTTVR